MNCTECHELISDYVDGTLELGEQTKIERHLADCEPCRAVRDDLLQIVHFSGQLVMHAPPNPAAMWQQIQTRIVAEQPKSPAAKLKNWWQRLFSYDFHFSVPRVAAVAAALIIVSVVSVAVFKKSAVDTTQNSAAVTNPQPLITLNNDDMQEMEQQIKSLKETIEKRKASWGSDLQLSYERSMVYVDQSLDESRQECRKNPTDEACRDLLRNAYREKVRVLEGFTKF